MGHLLDKRKLQELELTQAQKHVLNRLRALLPAKHLNPETRLPYAYFIAADRVCDPDLKQALRELQDHPVTHFQCPVSDKTFRAPLAELRGSNINIYPVTLHLLDELGKL